MQPRTPKASTTRKDYNIYLLTDYERPVLWFPASTLAVQRRRLTYKMRWMLARLGSRPYIRQEGPDILHLYGRTWTTSFYIA